MISKKKYKRKSRFNFFNCSLLVIFAIMIFGLNISVISATIIYDDSSQAHISNGTSSGNCTNCINTRGAGVRVYAVNSETGDILPGTTYFEVWFSEPADNTELFVLASKSTRQAIIASATSGNNIGTSKKFPGQPIMDVDTTSTPWKHSGSLIGWQKIVSTYDFPLLKEDSSLSSFHGLTIPQRYTDALGVGDLMIKHIKTQFDQGNYEPLNQVLAKLGVKHSDGKTEIVFGEGGFNIQSDANYLKQISLQFEPLIIAKNHGPESGKYIFMGTVSEFAYFNTFYGAANAGFAGGRGGCNDLANWAMNNGYEGIYADEKDHAALHKTGQFSGLVCDNSNYDVVIGDWFTDHKANGVGFIDMEDFISDCVPLLDEILKEFNHDKQKLKSDLALKKLSELQKVFPAFELLTEWVNPIYGKDYPECSPLPKLDCSQRLQQIKDKYMQQYKERYENYDNCYYYNGRYYRNYMIFPSRYYYYFYSSNYDRSTGRYYYGTCRVNSYISDANKMEIIWGWAMNDLQTLYNEELADGRNYNLLTDWKSFGEPEPLCEYREKECLPINHHYDVDECVTGYSYFKDEHEVEIWRDCELAFSASGAKYSSDNTGHVAIDATYEKTNGGIVGNYDYCEVFCSEEINTTFPTSVKGVKAGRTFRWGSANGIFGNVSVKKICSNKEYIKGEQGYQFEIWEERYLANEKELIRHYMKKASYEKMLSKIRTSSSFGCRCCSWGTCCSGSGENRTCTTCCKRRCEYRGYANVSGDSHSWSHSYVSTVTGSVSSQSLSVGCYGSASAARSAAKSAMISRLNSYANSEYASYTGRISQEQELLKKIRQCTSNIKYVYDTSIRFIFKEPVNATYGANTRNFSYDDFLDVNGSYNENNVNTSKCKWFNAYSYTCSGFAGGASCTATLQRVRDCEIVTWDIRGTYSHSYPVEDFIWYSLKIDATLVNEKNKGPQDESFFYYIGFGLPTAFSLTNGTYELKAVVSKIGDAGQTQAIQDDITDGIVDYNTEHGHFWPMAQEYLISNANIPSGELPTGDGYGFEYICTYEVENQIFGYDCMYNSRGKISYNSPAYCDDDEDDDSDGSLVGIDVAYRLVTLIGNDDSISVAFPGILGYGRSRGSNWNLPTTTIREILDENVYVDSQAMYEIMLDVNAINLIRESNEGYFNAGKDPYTSYYDENNSAKVYCAADSTGNQKYCASDFISDLYIGRGLNYRLLGTCLPTSNTKKRAEHILENGCNTKYKYPDINWMR